MLFRWNIDILSAYKTNITKEEKMKQTKELNPALKKYSKMGIIAAAVIVVALIGVWAVSSARRGVDTASAIKDVSETAVSAADLRVAVVSMDKIQTEAAVLEDLHKQRTSFENKLKNKLEKEQKEIEKEKADIEKSQDVLSQEALQRRVVEYQRRVSQFQRELSESAQAIDSAYQDALNTVQKKHLDPIIEGIIAKKKLDLVIDGRMARVGTNTAGLDITDEVVKALNKKISSVKMATPKGL